MSASEAWHALDPNRALDDETALRRTFDKLDLDGNGVIDASELRVALISALGVPPAGSFAGFMLDAQVDKMIHWADADKDGKISFSDYKKIIKAGCTPDGGRRRARSPMCDPLPTPEVIHGGPPGWSASNAHVEHIHAYGEDGKIFYL